MRRSPLAVRKGLLTRNLSRRRVELDKKLGTIQPFVLLEFIRT